MAEGRTTGITVTANGRTEVVEATGDKHHEVSETGLGVAKAVFDDPATLDADDDVLGSDTAAGEPRGAPLLCRVEVLATRVLLRLIIEDDTLRRKALAATILMSLATCGEGALGLVCGRLGVDRTRHRGATIANLRLGEGYDADVLNRVRLCFPL